MYYIGKKGYTLSKSTCTPEQEETIKRELTIKPIQGSRIGCSQPTTSYPVYRESVGKYYLPRHYGITTFGPADIRLPPGTPIDIPFVGELRPNQIPVVETYLNHIQQGGSGGLLSLPCAFGKTCLSLYLLSKLKVKTIIVVHKTFLLNQWVERISQFLPTARVGRIQGPVIDIENQDIVIAMLQSLSMKTYDGSIFDSFGLTIIDEVHHISSEVFSRALFQLVTSYTLGLSATMNRKDGTTQVFKWFLGDILFDGKRDEEHPVVVRVINYTSKDADFEEVEVDMRGQVKYSTMITKISNYTPRTRFLVRVIHDMMTENPNQQIIVLAHTRALLEECHTLVEEHGWTTGYYVGGMKEAALKESESKQVIFATYSMAAEALDIKTLTTLVMATPKTDIEQAVGRILRVKHGSPVVVDLVDPHDPFQNQYYKRRTFYKKHRYTLIGTSSSSYSSSNTVWKTLWTPTATTTAKKESRCLVQLDPKEI